MDRFAIEAPSRPGEFHPQPLTEPYVTVSRHTALAALDKEISNLLTNDKTDLGLTVLTSGVA